MQGSEVTTYPPLGLVLPDRTVKGINSLDEDPEIFTGPCEDVGLILNREYGKDAHFITYYPRGDEARSEDYPRCNKPVLDSIRAAGEDLVAGWLVFDIDNQGHIEHKSPTIAREMFEGLCEMTPKPHVVYTTRNGARFMYALEHPVPVDVLEEMLPGFAATLPVDVDEATFDWTRLFRVPKATRDYIQQWTGSWFHLRIDRGNLPLLKISDVPRIKPQAKDNRTRLRQVEAEYGEQPSVEEAMDLLYEIEASAMAVLEMMTRRARNRICDPVLFGNTEIAPSNGPGRMNAIQSYVGDACRLFYPIVGCSPQLVYSMFIEKGVINFLPDLDTPDWTVELWSAVCRYWAAEESKDENPEATRAGPEDPKQEEQLTLLSKMALGAAQWATDFPARTSPEARQAWIQKRVIALGPKGEIHLMGKNGFYDSSPIDKLQLVPALRDRGLDQIIPLEELSGKTMHERNSDQIIRAHSTTFVDKRLVMAILDSEGKPSGRILAMGSDVATFEYSTFARKDIEPAFDADVDEWLRAFTGDQYELLNRWIAWALAFEEGPICAVGIYGPPGIGKKLITRGLTECITTEEFGTGEDFGRWGYGIVFSPWLFVNEGFPSGPGTDHIADTFRKYVDGESVRVELKFQAPFKMANPLRIMLLSNNKDLISELAQGRDMTPDDRQAVAERLIVINASKDARDLLKKKRGMAHTRGWIGGDDGSPGDLRVARHFLELYRRRHSFVRDSRFLVEGSFTPELEEILTLNSGGTPQVVEAVINAVENNRPNKTGVYVDPKGQLWVTSSAVVDQSRLDAQKGAGRPFSHNMAGRIIRGVTVSEGHSVIKNFQGSRTKWHHIDMLRIKSYAEQYGIPHKKLDAILSGRAPDPPRIVVPIKGV